MMQHIANLDALGVLNIEGWVNGQRAQLYRLDLGTATRVAWHVMEDDLMFTYEGDAALDIVAQEDATVHLPERVVVQNKEITVSPGTYTVVLLRGASGPVGAIFEKTL